MSTPLRLSGLVSERPREVDPLHRELRELLAENERLLERNATLEREHGDTSPVYRELREVLVENGRLIERNRRLKRELGEAQDQIATLALGAGPAPFQPILELGRLRLNHDLRQLSLDRRTVQVTNRCLEILGYLMARHDRVIQTETLAKALNHTDGDAVRTLIYRVRERLAVIGAERYLRSHGRSWSGGGYWMSSSHEVEP